MPEEDELCLEARELRRRARETRDGTEALAHLLRAIELEAKAGELSAGQDRIAHAAPPAEQNPS